MTVDTFYLTPVLTSRRGVFHLTRDLVAERLDEGLEYICSLAMSGFEGISPPDVLPHDTAVINGTKCVFCYNCYRACSHAALEPDPKESRMQHLSAACTGCGICKGICPANAIMLENIARWMDDDPKRSLVICCENSGGATIGETDDIDILIAPCRGFIEADWLSDFTYDYEKVLVVVCPDDACRHFNGNKRACKQVKHLQNLLKSAGLSTDRIRIVQASQAMPNVLRDEMEAYLH